MQTTDWWKCFLSCWQSVCWSIVKPLRVWINKTITSARMRKVTAHRSRDWTVWRFHRAQNTNDTDCFVSHVLPWFPSLFFPSLCYRCHCPPQLEGPDCQQTRLSFLGNGYAWFPPIRPCFDSHLSLEFMTEEDDGLLLYAGPLATLLPGDVEDYMAIGKEWVWIIRCVPRALRPLLH